MAKDTEQNSFLDNLKGNMLFQKAATAYLDYYAGNSHHTSKAKNNDFSAFFEFLKNKKGINLERFKLSDWTHSLTVEFLDYLLGCGQSPATVARRLATLKHFGRIMSENIPQFLNPAKEVRPPKLQKGRPKSLQQEQILNLKERLEAMLEEKPNFARFRNLVIFELLIETGLRAEEARTLKVSQLDTSLEWIKNVKTKGKKYRNVYVASSIRNLLRDYLKAREQELRKKFPKLTKKISQSLPLFISLYGAVPSKPDSFLMGAKSFWRAIAQISKEYKLHPHLLRHSFATALLDTSKDIRLVAQALGHSDIRITMRYTERTEEQIAKAIENKNKS